MKYVNTKEVNQANTERIAKHASYIGPTLERKLDAGLTWPQLTDWYNCTPLLNGGKKLSQRTLQRYYGKYEGTQSVSDTLRRSKLAAATGRREKQLRKQGFSWQQVATKVSKEFGEDISPDAARMRANSWTEKYERAYKARGADNAPTARNKAQEATEQPSQPVEAPPTTKPKLKLTKPRTLPQTPEKVVTSPDVLSTSSEIVENWKPATDAQGRFII